MLHLPPAQVVRLQEVILQWLLSVHLVDVLHLINDLPGVVLERRVSEVVLILDVDFGDFLDQIGLYQRIRLDLGRGVLICELRGFDLPVQ